MEYIEDITTNRLNTPVETMRDGPNTDANVASTVTYGQVRTDGDKCFVPITKPKDGLTVKYSTESSFPAYALCKKKSKPLEIGSYYPIRKIMTDIETDSGYNSLSNHQTESSSSYGAKTKHISTSLSNCYRDSESHKVEDIIPSHQSTDIYPVSSQFKDSWSSCGLRSEQNESRNTTSGENALLDCSDGTFDPDAMFSGSEETDPPFINKGNLCKFDNGTANSRHKANRKWVKQARSLRDIFGDDGAPLFIKHIHGELNKYIPDRLVERRTGAVLKLLEVRRQKLLVGRRMLWDRMRQEHAPSQSTFEMPANTKGWFEVFPEDGRPVQYFDTIYGITSVKANRFLVRTSTVGYRMTMEDGVSTWLPCEIKAGETLTAGIIYMDSKKQTPAGNIKNMLKRFWKQGKVGHRREQDLRYLQCFDNDGREIMIPLVMSGVFSPIGDPSTTNYEAVYDLNDLLLAFPLPVRAQLVHSNDKTRSSVPKGVMKIENSREEEFALVTLNGSTETFEIPLDDDLLFYKEQKKHRTIGKEISLSINETEIVNKSYEGKSTANKINLPTKTRDSRKSKGAGLLEKLSQRKTKKERRSLKALQEQGVFSSKLTKPEMTYDDFYLGFKNAESESSALPNVQENESTSQPQTTVPDKHRKIGDKPKILPKPKINLNTLRGKTQNVTEDMNKVMPTRSLPPIPGNSEEAQEAVEFKALSDSTETLYEKLPSSPRLQNPSTVTNNDGNYSEGQDTSVIESISDDGYLAPSEVRYVNEVMLRDSPCYDDVYVKKAVNALGENEEKHGHIMKSNSTDPFIKSSPNRGCHQDMHEVTESPPYAPTYNNYRRARIINGRYKRNMVHASTTAIPDCVVSYSDSFRNAERCAASQDILNYALYEGVCKAREVACPYPRSEPGYRQFGGLSDTYIKNGDDSAISMCSRGDYVVGSDYSYTSFTGNPEDDNWIPPEDIANLSVAEVSKCLRYIGMKDRIVIRFSREQIDGEMLCSLNEKLLVEGFSELNALEVKKVLDFVSGWRPKK